MTALEAFTVPVRGKGSVADAARALCRGILEKGLVEAVMAPMRLPDGIMVQHVLTRDPESLGAMDILAPVMAVNGATLVARLTRQEISGQVAALLRPCEIRAFMELVKLNQGDRSRVLIIGMDCLGTMEPPEYRQWALGVESPGWQFFQAMMGQGSPPQGAPDIRTSCKACEFPTPVGADLELMLLGSNSSEGLTVSPSTQRGAEVMANLGAQKVEVRESRKEAIASLIERRKAFRDELLGRVERELLPLENLLKELSRCINCYNCRDVCPVCYCKSCVMDSSTMEHPSEQYLRWAKRRSMVKMPVDTLFYHMTRMAHMSTSCVGCGQCSSGCPMGIKVAEIFMAVSRRTQRLLDYVPGRSLDEPIPLATFREEELEPR
jgi:formate dehydrogenase subunit beta